MAKVTQASAERAIKAAYAISFLQGIIAISLVPRVPELVTQLHLDFAGWGALIGAVSLSSLLPLVLANKLIMKFGTRPIMSFGGILFAGSLAFIPWCNSAWEFAIVAMAQTIAGATFNIALQSATVMLQKQTSSVIKTCSIKASSARLKCSSQKSPSAGRFWPWSCRC